MSNLARNRNLAQVTPGLEINDPLMAYWLGQVHLRLRRELAWCWLQRTGEADPGTGALPPMTGIADDALGWSRVEQQRRHFFERDATAGALTELIEAPPPDVDSRRRGSWAWLSDVLALNDADHFALALAVAHRLDAAMGVICAAAINDLNRAHPSLALAQWLWDEPMEILPLADEQHALRRHGLLHGEAGDWQAELAVPAWLAQGLVGEHTGRSGMEEIPMVRQPLDRAWQLNLRSLEEEAPGLRRVPLLGAADADFIGAASAIAAQLNARLVAIHPVAWNPARVRELLAWCWLHGLEPLLPWGVQVSADQWPLALPLRVWQPMEATRFAAESDSVALQSPLELREIDYHRRLEILEESLGSTAAQWQDAVQNCARRFRFTEPTLRRVARAVRNLGSWNGDDLVRACRQETRDELAQLAQPVQPRFSSDELVLAAAQQEQFDEVVRAMDSLTVVHYRWGTARAWSEGGLSVLFCGPPGTGKTMAAEALATRLSLDMYRVDLAQVVSKYVGDTEKNLRRIFDAAEASDCLLFFDEADALFGKRTEVKDAHDRYANIEVSYLLERMERFKGLAILASNRRKDMDEAFMRRLRYCIDFPVPGVDERERIWRQGFPDKADTSDLDFRFLARQFAFSGGHIRSVIFNSCLQSAAAPEGEPAADKVGKPSMRQVLVQVRRELQKLNRSAGDELFGRYADLLEDQAA